MLAALKAGEVTDTIRASLEWVLQQLIEAEATAFNGAAPFERTDMRTAQRNGHRPRLLSTPAGDVDLEIPKLRQGSCLVVLAVLQVARCEVHRQHWLSNEHAERPGRAVPRPPRRRTVGCRVVS